MLKGEKMIEIIEKTDSTNEYLKNKKNKSNYCGVIAKKQTKGRGTRGRIWFADEGSLIFSFVIKEDKNISMLEYLKLPLIVGMSLLKTLTELEDLPFMFKWTNDIYLYDKKLSGILVEKIGDEFIVGIGLNLNCKEFYELSNIATSIYLHSSKEYNKIKVAENIIKNTKMYMDKFYKGKWQEILGEIHIYNYLKTNEIKFYSHEIEYEGIGQDIDKDGSMTLLVNNKILKFQVGEASTRKRN